MCDSGKGESFYEGSKKKGMRGRFLDCARNDGMGEWVYSTQRTTDMFVKRYSRIVIPSEVEGSFFAYRYSALCETAEKGKTLAKGARNDGVQGRFLAAPRMMGWGKLIS